MTYHDVVEDRKQLQDMLKYSDGRRSVPVLVENGQVTIGYGGT